MVRGASSSCRCPRVPQCGNAERRRAFFGDGYTLRHLDLSVSPRNRGLQLERSAACAVVEASQGTERPFASVGTSMWTRRFRVAFAGAAALVVGTAEGMSLYTSLESLVATPYAKLEQYVASKQTLCVGAGPRKRLGEASGRRPAAAKRRRDVDQLLDVCAEAQDVAGLPILETGKGASLPQHDTTRAVAAHRSQ